jgi:hypothetical protein
MHAALAWAFLAKGPGAWLVPIAAAAGLIVLERNWRELSRYELWVPLLIPMSVIGAWVPWVSKRPDGAHELAVLLWYNVAGRVVAPDRFDQAMLRATHVLVAVLIVVLLAAGVLVGVAEPPARGLLSLFVVAMLAAGVALAFSLGCLRKRLWQPFLATTCAAFVLAVLAACSLMLPAIDRWQDYASLIRRIDRDTAGRDLDLYTPDETTLAVVDLYATRHRGRWHIRAAAASQTLPTNSVASHAVLVLLPGHAAGFFSRILRRWGISMQSPSGAKQLNGIEQERHLRVARIYEVSEGRLC